MALNFPDSPTLNQVYTDTTSGFSYQWDGVVWQSYSAPASKNISIVDDISGSFDGVTDNFSLSVSGESLTPANAQQLRVVLGGIVQEPGVDYTVSGPNITFTTPPSGGLDCSIVSLGPALPQNNNIPNDGSVTPAKLSTGGPYWNTGGDLNVSGVVTATSFVGDGSGITGISSVSFATTSFGLSGTPNVIVGVVTATSVSVSGNVSIAGTLTYEDVTNVDSIGIVTARSGIVLGPTANTVQLGTGTTISSPGSDTFTISTNGSERVRVDSSGRLAVGTASPGYLFTAKGTTGGQEIIHIDSSAAYPAVNAVRYTCNNNNNWADVNHYAQTHRWFANGSTSEAARIDSSGRFGLGTSSPGELFHVNNGTARISTVAKASSGTFLALRTSDASNPMELALSNSTNSYWSIQSVEQGVAFRPLVLNPSGGNVGVATAAPSESLHVIGNILASGNVTGYSDETLKDNIQTIPDALDKVSQLRGVEFDRNDIKGNPHQIGVIAQEVEKVIPEVVTTHNDGIKSVAYGNLVGVLIEAIKELKEEVNELKARLEEV